MGTEFVRTCMKEDDIDFPAVPPGFESFTSFKLKKVENTESELGHSVLLPNLAEQQAHISVELDHEYSRKISRTHRRRYGQCSNLDDESTCEQLDQSISMKTSLPKGVIRGCAECKNCQKVVGRYKPEASCRPNLQEAPVFYPTEEEFEDALSYIGKIRHEAESYGICRIVPPSSWKPPCHLKEKSIWEKSMFATRVQKVDKLQNREPMRKTCNHTMKKRRKCFRMGADSGAGNGHTLEPLESEFGFEPGPEFTLDAFQRYADHFMINYFRDLETNVSTEAPSIESIEGEYWRVVERPTEEIEVLYGADLETGAFGSGFPKTVEQTSARDEQYVKSGWNLNNLPRVMGSVLTYESSDISGVQVPWLYIGMCFSSFCWHVEDHYMYSLNYMHFGAPKLWYGVPGKDATKLEEAMRKHLPDLFDEQPDLLHKLVTQLSPTILKSEGVPVYRCVQNPGEFVITFPRAYHGGFNSGFNCAEAVNVAPVDWFPHGQNAVELYSEQRRKTTISHDKLLLGAAMEAVKANCELNFMKKNTDDNLRWKNVCGDGILAKSLKARVNMERVRRDFLCKSAKVLQMLNSFDAATERECSVCFFDLHLSAAGCGCSPERYACLNHAKQLCSCGWSEKFVLIRYDMNDLDLLVEAIEGKLSSVYRWARTFLGFSLSSQVSQVQETTSKEESLQPSNGATVTNNKIRFKKELCKSSTSNIIGTYHQQSSEKPEVKKSSSEQDVICLSDDEGDEFNRIDNKSDLRNKNIVASVPVQVLSNTRSASQSVVIALGVQKKINKVDVQKKINKVVDETPVSNVIPKVVDDANTLSCSQSSIEKPHHQKGPRIAKVVRRINCDVEPLEFGSVVSGKQWSNSRCIFPKGFKSRVRYINILEPSNMCHYVSEVLEWGAKEPLFMVYLEQCRSEVFAHVTPTRCWEMVRERVNQEISRQHKLGKLKLPPLQPPGSLDGFEMFGFTSASIIQAIETMDKKRVSVEYWRCRPIADVTVSDANSGECDDRILSRVFKKANSEELRALVRALGEGKSASDFGLVSRLVKEEVYKRDE